MRKCRLGMRLEEAFQGFPGSTLIRDFLAGSKNRKQSAQQLHLIECFLQFDDQTLPLQQAPFALGDVTNGGGDEYFSTSLHRAETNVDWKLRTIFAPTVQF